MTSILYSRPSVVASLSNRIRFLCPFHKVQIIQHATKFWEPDKKFGYYQPRKLQSVKEQIRTGAKLFPEEMKKFYGEVKTKFECTEHMINYESGDYDVVWKFDNKEAVDDWVLTADSDHNEGKTTCDFQLGQNRTGIFHGHLNTEIPKDGVVKRAGYCCMSSPKNVISFQRSRPYNWEPFTHLLVRCRGDGRPYFLVIGMDRYYDVNWSDQYNFCLFTRGGPYWQTAKIPFSKFFMSAKGRIQDKQQSIVNNLDRVTNLGITMADNVTGPFKLEIDYIGLYYDESHGEEFAYEMYEGSPAVND